MRVRIYKLVNRHYMKLVAEVWVDEDADLDDIAAEYGGDWVEVM